MSIYKECDIRGLYKEELTEVKASLIGKAIGTMLRGTQVVVAGDARYSTNSLKKAHIEGLLSTGTDVIDIGMVPTPLLYFAKKEFSVNGGVMVTASHNPAQYNGFKVALFNSPIEPKDIEEIHNLVSSQQFRQGNGTYEKRDVTSQYLSMIDTQIEKSKALTLVVDCGNGAASELAPVLLERMGHNVIPLYCECKGDFPNRNPNPSVEENVQTLKESVVFHHADLGIAFDGDGDRVVFVDDKGRFCDSEAIFVLLSRYYLGKEGSGKIVYDGKSSSIVNKQIILYHGLPIPERSGHAFIKKRFLEENAILAGEVSGHYFFKELGHDDGLYGAVKFCQILLEIDEKLSTIMDQIEKPLITPDIRVYINQEERDKILKHVENIGCEFSLSYLDGVRVDYPYGWVVVRKSVTEPCITVRLESDNIEDAEKICNHLFRSEYPEIEKLVLTSLKERKK